MHPVMEWLMAAVCSGQAQRVQALLQQGASPHTSYEPDNRTVLHAAAQAGQVKVLHHLLDAGADVNARTSNGTTPLHLAIVHGYTPAVAALLERGASVTAADNDGWTALHHAARHGHTAVFQMLLKAGASLEASSTQCGAPLHCACHGRSCATASRLLALGAAVTSRDSKGRTPLHVSAGMGHLDLVRLLVGAGASVDVKDSQGQTPLMLAGTNHHMAVMEELVAHCSEPCASDDHGNMALHLACRHGAGDISRLLQATADCLQLDAANSSGQAPLHVALDSRQLARVRALLAAGADPNALYAGAVDEQGGSIPAGTNPLQRAVQMHFREAVPLLATRTNLRRTCHAQAPQGEKGQQQQQQQHHHPGNGLFAPMAMADTLGKVLRELLWGAQGGHAQYTHAEQAVSCLEAVRDVLGEAAVGQALGQVLDSHWHINCSGMLLQALYSRCMAPIQDRWRIIQRIQQLVVEPQQQQLQQQQEDGTNVRRLLGQQLAPAGDLKAAGQAAADSGQWLPFARQLEQQVWLEPTVATAKPYLEAVSSKGPVMMLSHVKGLCAALLKVQQQPAHIMPKEMAAAMVSAVGMAARRHASRAG
jgi:ankyrin repeat protein